MDEFVFKLVFLGDAGVGKSALVLRFVRDEYLSTSESTIGAAFLSKNIEVDRKPTRVEIWDTAGQERYRALAPMYFRGAQAGIVTYDLTVRESFEGAKRWVRDLQRSSEPGLVIALVGNKSDLASSRVVDASEAEEYANENGLLYMETSARTASNVNHLFMEVARRVPRDNSDALAYRQEGVVMGRSALPGVGGKGAKTADGRKRADARKGGCCG